MIIFSNIKYLINEVEKTADVIGCSQKISEIIIPTSIKYETNEYIVMNILEGAFSDSQITSIRFASDSKIQKICKNALPEYIESLTIPSHVKELEEGWCTCTQYLNKIYVSPSNRYFKKYKEKIIIGKTKLEQTNFDTLVFCLRDVETITIPNFIKRICPNAFDGCNHLEKIEIPSDSKLQTIGKNAFNDVNIESLTIPSFVKKLEEGWCCNTPFLNKVFVHPSNQNFKSIDNKIIIGKSRTNQTSFDTLVFCSRNIESIIIPNYIKRIGPNAFDNCINLRQVKTTSDSRLQVIENNAFLNSSIEELFFSSQLKELNGNWCPCTKFLTKINISPSNRYFKSYENNMIIGKSKPEQINFDTLVFCPRDIEFVVIPNFIIKICKCAFSYSKKIKQLKFEKDSKLQLIDEEAFFASSIEKKIRIPSQVTKIEYNSFAYAFFSWIEFPDDSKLQIIGKCAFSGSAIESIKIPSNVIQIEDSSFNCCERLYNVEFLDDSKLQLKRLGFHLK